MYQEIQAAIASVRLVSDIVNASKDLRNYNELAGAVSEVNGKLMQAIGVALASQEKQAQLVGRIAELEGEIAQFKNWNEHAKDYALQAVAPGIYAYIYKPEVQGNKPRHWSCVNCFQQQKQSLFQYEHGTGYKCSNCGNEIEPWANGQTLPIDSAYQ